MTFDALTIAGIVTAALSGGFVLALAMAEASSRSTHRRSSRQPLPGTRVARGWVSMLGGCAPSWQGARRNSSGRARP